MSEGELPKIKGRKTPVEKPKEESLQPELALQDVDIPRPPEIVTPTPDVPTLTEASYEARSDAQASTVKRTVSDKQRAALEKARLSKLEKKRLREAGTDLANAPDTQPQYLIEIQQKMDAKFAEFTKTLTDLRSVLPASKPLLPEEQEKIIPSQAETPPEIDSFSNPSKRVALNPPTTQPNESLSMDYNGPVYANRVQKERLTNQQLFEQQLRAKSKSRNALLFEDSPDARAANRIIKGDTAKYITF